MANPMPTPATPTPAMSGAIATPTFSSTIVSASPHRTSRTTRTMSTLTGGSSSRLSSQRNKPLLIHLMTSMAMTRMMVAPRSFEP